MANQLKIRIFVTQKLLLTRDCKCIRNMAKKAPVALSCNGHFWISVDADKNFFVFGSECGRFAGTSQADHASVNFFGERICTEVACPVGRIVGVERYKGVDVDLFDKACGSGSEVGAVGGVDGHHGEVEMRLLLGYAVDRYGEAIGIAFGITRCVVVVSEWLTEFSAMEDMSSGGGSDCE